MYQQGYILVEEHKSRNVWTAHTGLDRFGKEGRRGGEEGEREAGKGGQGEEEEQEEEEVKEEKFGIYKKGWRTWKELG